MHPTARGLIRPAALGTLIGAVGVAVAHVLATALNGPLILNIGATAPLATAVLFTVLGGVVGYVLALLVRRAGRPRTLFLVITLVAFALYLIAPFAAAPLSTALWLNVLHLVAAAAILPPLARALSPARVPANR